MDNKAATQEAVAFRISGFIVFFVTIALISIGIGIILSNGEDTTRGQGIGAILCFVLAILSVPGFFQVQPNESRVVTFLGKYVGTVRHQGFSWTNPFTQRKRISLRIRNFNSERLKVNDSMGNPIEIACVVVWRVVQTAKASFDVDNYSEFVSIQTEIAIRTLATHFPYDSDDSQISLRGKPDEVADVLLEETQAKLVLAGVEILETRLTHLAYSQEIAQAMLRRQQAQAIIAARQQIVEGAVGMVETALQMLSDQKIVELDEEKKATMVNNLLVVLTSEHDSQPIINVGTLYG